MTYRWMIVAVLALALSSCKTASSAETGGATDAATQSGVPSEATSAPSRTLEVPPRDGAPAVTLVDYEGSTLRVGREDGSFAEHTGDGFQITEPLREAGEILAWSSDGRLAIVDGEPPVIVRRSDGREVLRFVHVESVEIAGFFADGSGLFIGEPSGQLHVWNESVDTLESVAAKDLESFIARQSPSFSAGFNPLSGRATVTRNNEFLLGTSSGKLMWWNPTSPEQVQTLVKLDGPIADTAYAGGKIYATTGDGQFRAAKTSSRTFLEWSAEVKAKYVAAAPGAPMRIVVADDSAITMIAVDDGSEVWSRAIADGGTVCGLGLSADGQTGAICIDGSVVVFDADGEAIDSLP